MAGLREKWLEYAAIRFDALKHARRALLFSALVRSAKPLCQNVAKRRGILLCFFSQGCLALALPLGVEAKLDVCLARGTANTLLAGALTDFDRSAREFQTSLARVRA